VPCRLGSQKLVSLSNHILAGQVTAERWKTELTPLVKEMGKAIELSSICGLGRSVPVPILTTMNFFAEDVARHLSGNGQGSAASQS
jgi:NADH:ubiquinone oxidoreductase subunit F (NADH-binding)